MNRIVRRMGCLCSERMKITFYTLLCATLIGSLGKAENLSIQNAKLVVFYGTSIQRFSLTERGTRRAIVSDGRLLDQAVSGAQVITTSDTIFGKGRQIRVTYTDGAVCSLDVYP